MSDPAAPSTPQHSASIRWIAAAGAFLVSLDSLVNIAFPAMAPAFGAPPEAMRWVIVCYVLTYAIVSFAGGTAGDVVGHGRVFLSGVAIGTLGYVVCGAAPTFGWLLLGRVVQGIGAGLVYGTAPGILTLAAPVELRVRAIALFNAAVGLALAAGPPIAGLVVGAFGWRSVFFVRVPLALALLAGAVSAVPRRRASIGSPRVSAVEISRARVLGPCLLMFVANGGIFAVWLLAPFYLVGTRALPPAVSGLLFMLTPLAMTAAAPLAGGLTARVGAGRLVPVGLILEALGLLAMSRVGPSTPVIALAAAFALAGFGLGLFQAPNMATVMAGFGTARQGLAGGLALLARTLGVAGGVLGLGEVFAVRRAAMGFEVAFAETFVIAACCVALAGVAALAARAA